MPDVLNSNPVVEFNEDQRAMVLSVGIEPLRLQLISEPFVVFTSRGYAPIIKVLNRKKKSVGFLYLSAASLAKQLETLRRENGGRLSGLEFWIRRENSERTARYVLEES